MRVDLKVKTFEYPPILKEALETDLYESATAATISLAPRSFYLALLNASKLDYSVALIQ